MNEDTIRRAMGNPVCIRYADPERAKEYLFTGFVLGSTDERLEVSEELHCHEDQTYSIRKQHIQRHCVRAFHVLTIGNDVWENEPKVTVVDTGGLT